MDAYSGMTARALITLAFLILVPLAAVFGTRFTGGVSSAKQSAVPSNHPDKQATPPNAKSTRANENERSIQPSVTQNPVVVSNIVAGPNAASTGQHAQNTHNLPNLTNLGSSASQSVVAKPPIPTLGQADHTQIAGLPTKPANGHSSSLATPPMAAAPLSGDAATTDPFTWMQRRLRELGAIYYRLENGGPKGEIFRFQCQMAVPGSPSGVQPFEAIDGDPLKAMQRVLYQVEAWHSKLAR